MESDHITPFNQSFSWIEDHDRFMAHMVDVREMAPRSSTLCTVFLRRLRNADAVPGEVKLSSDILHKVHSKLIEPVSRHLSPYRDESQSTRAFHILKMFMLKFDPSKVSFEEANNLVKMLVDAMYAHNLGPERIQSADQMFSLASSLLANHTRDQSIVLLLHPVHMGNDVDQINHLITEANQSKDGYDIAMISLEVMFMPGEMVSAKKYSSFLSMEWHSATNTPPIFTDHHQFIFTLTGSSMGSACIHVNSYNLNAYGSEPTGFPNLPLVSNQCGNEICINVSIEPQYMTSTEYHLETGGVLQFANPYSPGSDSSTTTTNHVRLLSGQKFAGNLLWIPPMHSDVQEIVRIYRIMCNYSSVMGNCCNVLDVHSETGTVKIIWKTDRVGLNATNVSMGVYAMTDRQIHGAEIG